MQGAIMAVGASQPNAVATKDGRIGMKSQMQVRNSTINAQVSEWFLSIPDALKLQCMQVNITADHRVIYGSDLASFLKTLASIIEDPKDLTF